MKLLPSYSLLLLVACAPLGAITIQNTATPGYVTGNSVYTGVASIIGNYSAGGSFSCTGALISSTVILTAGHCVAPANSWNVTFKTATAIQEASRFVPSRSTASRLVMHDASGMRAESPCSR